MSIINGSCLVRIIRRTLNRADKRLISHGERVAYIMLKILQVEGKYTAEEMNSRAFLGLIHDIGAYKTEEIDMLFSFESNNTWQHSIFGSLFVKYFSPCSEFADTILYHNYPFDELSKLKLPEEIERISSLIFLADRIDLIIHKSKSIYERNKHIAENWLNPYWVNLLEEAESKYSISENLINKNYVIEFDDAITNCPYSEKDIHSWLLLLASSIGFRSEATAIHSITMTFLSCAIGLLLKLPYDNMLNLYYGALLHDIGKVGTPIEILESPGKLSYSEMEIMKNHIVMTSHILKGNVSDQVYEIAVNHHEKCDGTGYPKGIKASNLPIEAHIAIIADILSALLGKRSYKEEFSLEKVSEIIKKMVQSKKIDEYVSKVALENLHVLKPLVDQKTKDGIIIYNNLRSDYSSMLEQVFAGQPMKMPKRCSFIEDIFNFEFPQEMLDTI